MAHFLKVLARSRSWSFARDFGARDSDPPGEPASVAWWSGDGRPVHYRRGTSDVALVYDILFKPGAKSEYWLPAELAPRTILDIGGNIGVAARYLAHRFPGAALHTFEPIAENCELLRRNMNGGAAIIHGFGLGARSGPREFGQDPGAERNRGGYSLARAGGGAVRAELRAVPEALALLGGAPIDLIKIDVEGAEEEILAAFPDAVLEQATWIYGELHSDSVDPRQAFRLLERLAAWFDIEVHKPLRKRNWFFDACNRRVSERFRAFRRRR